LYSAETDTVYDKSLKPLDIVNVRYANYAEKRIATNLVVSLLTNRKSRANIAAPRQKLARGSCQYVEGRIGNECGISGKRGQILPEAQRGAGEEQRFVEELPRLKGVKRQVSCRFGN